MLTKEQKVKVVSEIVDSLSDQEAMIISDYSNLKVNELTELRKIITTKGFKAKVQKNKILKRALDNQDIKLPEDSLKGQNIFFETTDDVVTLSKILVDFSKENENLEIKGGILEGKYIDTSQIQELSKLPTKEVLIAKFIGQLKNPLNKLVMTLSNPINGFVHVLSNIKNQNGGD